MNYSLLVIVITLLSISNLIHGLVNPTNMSWKTDRTIEIRWDDLSEGLIELDNSRGPCNFNGFIRHMESSVGVIGCPMNNTFKIVIDCNDVNGQNFKVENTFVTKVDVNNGLLIEEAIDIPSSDIITRSQSRIKTGKGRMPDNHELKIKVFYDKDFKNYYNGENESVEAINQFFTISQTHFNHKSLKVKIKLIIDDIVYVKKMNEKVKANRETILNIARRGELDFDPDIQSHILFTTDDFYLNSQNEVGIAFKGTICANYKENFKLAIVESYLTEFDTAKTLTHQLAINFGMGSDSDSNCKDIMDYKDFNESKWTPCTVKGLFNHYFNVITPENWCLKTSYDPKEEKNELSFF